MISHGHPEYKNFMIGKVKNYYLYKFLYMLLKLIVVILLLLAYKKTNNIIIILLLILYIGYFLVVIHNTYSSKQKQTISSLSKIYKNNYN
jgi:predicted MFS family arabinose efflux permease